MRTQEMTPLNQDHKLHCQAQHEPQKTETASPHSPNINLKLIKHRNKSQ